MKDTVIRISFFRCLRLVCEDQSLAVLGHAPFSHLVMISGVACQCTPTIETMEAPEEKIEYIMALCEVVGQAVGEGEGVF